MKILDIGCGKNKYKSRSKGDEVIGMDIAKLPGVNKVHNLEKFPWPFKKNEFDVIEANNVLEHLGNIPRTMEEIYRVLKTGGILHAIVPIYPSINQFIDPTHKSFFTHKTFDYFTEECNLSYYSKARFKIIQKNIIFNRWIQPIMNIINKNKLAERIYFYSLAHIIPPSVMEIRLRKEPK